MCLLAPISTLFGNRVYRDLRALGRSVPARRLPSFNRSVKTVSCSANESDRHLQKISSDAMAARRRGNAVVSIANLPGRNASGGLVDEHTCTFGPFKIHRKNFRL